MTIKLISIHEFLKAKFCKWRGDNFLLVRPKFLNRHIYWKSANRRGLSKPGSAQQMYLLVFLNQLSNFCLSIFPTDTAEGGGEKEQSLHSPRGLCGGLALGWGFAWAGRSGSAIATARAIHVGLAGDQCW